MTIQTSIQKPEITEFVPIGIGNKRVLPYPVRSADGSIYYDQYFSGIRQIELAKQLYPELKLFVPSAVHIGRLFEKVKPFWVGTGTVILRPGKDGYADKRVRYKDGAKVELRTPVIGHHGESWLSADNGKTMVVIDYQKLREYPEIGVFKKIDFKYIRGFDKKERGVPIEFSGEPSEECNNEGIWVNPNLLVVPLGRGNYYADDHVRLFGSVYHWGSSDDFIWKFPLGSEASVIVNQP